MSKDIKLGSSAREELVKGIDILTDAVVSTLGPNGRNVVISSGDIPQSTKDGVTVAKSISLKDPTQELGVQLVKQAAIQTANKAGDGTTTSTVLAREMIKGGLTALNNNENAVQIKRDIDATVKEIVTNCYNFCK
jgi:chaperonin GroEL